MVEKEQPGTRQRTHPMSAIVGIIARENERRAVPIVCVKTCAYNTE